MKYLAALAVLLAATPPSGGVGSSAAERFKGRQTASLLVPPDLAWSSFASIEAWWDPEHTYSGKSENLSLNLAPGGCFCERFPAGGGIEHMRVTYVDPGKRVVLTGALGPLLYEAATGVMDVQ